MSADVLHWLLTVTSTSYIVVKLTIHSSKIKKMSVVLVKQDNRNRGTRNEVTHIDTGGGDYINITNK